jgi:hypothetical protein
VLTEEQNDVWLDIFLHFSTSIAYTRVKGFRERALNTFSMLTSEAVTIANIQAYRAD